VFPRRVRTDSRIIAWRRAPSSAHPWGLGRHRIWASRGWRPLGCEWARLECWGKSAGDTLRYLQPWRIPNCSRCTFSWAMSTTYLVNTNLITLDLTGQHPTTDNVESRHVPQEFVSHVAENVPPRRGSNDLFVRVPAALLWPEWINSLNLCGMCWVLGRQLILEASTPTSWYRPTWRTPITWDLSPHHPAARWFKTFQPI